MQDKQVHTLKACSLVAIPPPEQRMPPLGGFPKDLATLNLKGWAGLIQDVAQGMRMVPSNLSMEVYADSMVLLQLLEATTGMWYCRICSQLTPSCLCSGAYTSVPTETWSQTMASVPAQGVAASSAGCTTSEASTVEAQEPGLTSPPPGLTPLDFSSWSLLLLGAPQTGRLPLPSGGGVAGQAAGSWALGPWALMPSTPQGMLHIHQQRPRQHVAPYQRPAPPTSQPMAPYQQAILQSSQPITPYQQAMQPLSLAGRGGATQSASSAAIPTIRQPVQERRRQPTRGRGLLGRGRSASRLRHGCRLTAGAPATYTQGDAQPWPGRHTRTSHYDPAILAGNYCSSSWQKDLEHVLKVYYRYNLQAPFDEFKWIRVRELFFDHFVAKKAEALRIKEESPLDYMPFIAGEFYGATGIRLHELQDFTRWIKKNSYYHGLLVHRGQIEEIPHLIGEGPPKWPQLKPSESHQNSYGRAEGPIAGSSEPAASQPAAPTQETPVEEPLMVDAPVPAPLTLVCLQPPHKKLLQRSPPGWRLLSLAPLTPVHLLRWRQAEQETVSPGPTGLKLVPKQKSGRSDPPNILVRNHGDGGWVQHSPYPSRIQMVGMPWS